VEGTKCQPRPSLVGWAPVAAGIGIDAVPFAIAQAIKKTLPALRLLRSKGANTASKASRQAVEVAETFLALRAKAEHLTRGEMFAATNYGCERDPRFIAEKEDDLVDIRQANLTTMKKLETRDLNSSGG
jgi:hypothetical protein